MRHSFLRSLAGQRDPYFKNVTLLLHGDGTNGGQNNTFLDSSPNNNTITRTGNVTQGSFSPFGDRWSNYFDGTGDYLNAPDNAAFAFGTGDFTIEYWIYAISFSNSPTIIDTRSSTASTNGFSDYFNSSGNYLLFIGNSTIYTSASTVSTNTWTHIAVARSGTSLRVFINGIQSGSTVTNSTNFSNQKFLIGSNINLSASYANAYISNVRAVKGTAVYITDFNVPTSPLATITNTSILTCQSNRFLDASANNFTITRNGDVSVQRFSPFSPDAPYRTDRIAGSAYFSGANSNSLSASSSAVEIGRNAFTVESWVYYLGTNNHTWFNPTPGIPFTVIGTTLRCYYGPNGTGGFLSGGIVPRAWTHIAVTRDFSNVLRLFVNGVFQSNAIVTDSHSSTPIIGERSGNGAPFSGYIAGFRLLIHTALYTSNFTPPSSPPAVVNDTQWLVNFTNSSIADNAMMNNLQTVGNAQISTSVKKFGTGSLAFDGTGDWLLVPNSSDIALAGDFTIEAWVYVTAGGSNRGIVTIGDRSTSTGLTLMWQSSAFFKVFVAGSEILAASSAVGLNTWAHVAVTRNGTGAGNMKIYLNGVYQQQYGAGSNAIFSGVSGNGLCIGASYSAGSFIEAHQGNIDDLRITKGFARYTGTSSFTVPTASFPDF